MELPLKADFAFVRPPANAQQPRVVPQSKAGGMAIRSAAAARAPKLDDRLSKGGAAQQGNLQDRLGGGGGGNLRERMARSRSPERR